MLAAAKAVRKGNVKGYAIGIDASRFATGIYSRGEPILSDDQKKAVFNNDQGVAQIAFYQQVITSGAGYQTAKAGDDQTDFVAGKAAFFFASSTRISQLQQDVPTGANFRWGAAMPPHGTGLNPVADMYGGNVMILQEHAGEATRRVAADQVLHQSRRHARLECGNWVPPGAHLWTVRAPGSGGGAEQSPVRRGYAVAGVRAAGTERAAVNTIRAEIQDAMVAAVSYPTKSAKQLLDDAVDQANQALAQ